jgi:hypothetical protein
MEAVYSSETSVLYRTVGIIPLMIVLIIATAVGTSNPIESYEESYVLRYNGLEFVKSQLKYRLNKAFTCCLLHAGVLLVLLLTSEDGGGMLLRNVGCLSQDYSRRYNTSVLHCFRMEGD